jgi:hypothetical protein
MYWPKLMRDGDSRALKIKAPKGKSESPWSLYIGHFRKIHFINPPEVQVRLSACSFKGREKVKKKYQNPLFRSIRKWQGTCQTHYCPNHPHFFKE